MPFRGDAGHIYPHFTFLFFIFPKYTRHPLGKLSHALWRFFDFYKKILYNIYKEKEIKYFRIKNFERRKLMLDNDNLSIFDKYKIANAMSDDPNVQLDIQRNMILSRLKE